MKRRQFARQAAIATASATLAACTQKAAPTISSQAAVSETPMIRWRMATSWTKSIPIVFSGAEIIVQRVAEMTNGRFVITPYAADEIVSGLKVMDAVQAGTVECGHTLSYYYTQKNPALAFASTMPFGLTAYQQNAWMYEGGGLEALNQVYAAFGLIGFPAGNTGVQMGGWFNRQVNTVADLKGLKMRIPGLGGQVLAKLGVEVKLLAGGQIYAALEKGEIDAAEWQGPNDDENLGLDRVASFYYYPGWWEPGTNYAVLINLQEWNQLPQRYQQIFQAAAAEANLKVLAQYDMANSERLNQLLAKGTQLLPFNSEILKAAHKTAFEIYEELAIEHAEFKKIYQNWNEFRSQIHQWNRINELSFSSFAINRNQPSSLS
ncbi:ABC transporter substrate-binding protein [Leptolyngbya sp. FACHB-711]|uniref:TRAP transporter substrate-binding protein n=1 Tax=unclassified Leptolyngbya TaxID=2650499 RepID=UPI0016889353|nr:ABC transporter substrate-binding protein [Leptolyngbya sp. FACHB-711]MBD1852133.1 ABC transporter substrate-binding protein [Cyanobacteria bacterium FACHB-502]MBD2025578.1 ABC transporter substrate-binding protein [Leptolyngbya sp. FACHB-711]